MPRFQRITEDVKDLEEIYKRAFRPKLPKNPLRDLDPDRQLLIFKLCMGLKATVENGKWKTVWDDPITGRWNERCTSSILCTEDSPWGMTKQEVFDFLEERDLGDAEAKKWVLKLLKKEGLDAKRLLHNLHLYLIRQVLDSSRELLWAKAGERHANFVHEEFDLDARSRCTNLGPPEIRLSEEDAQVISQADFVSLLKKAYAENCVRWRLMLKV